MSGCTALFNNWNPSDPTKSTVSLWFNTGTAQCGVSIRNSNSSEDPTKIFAAAEGDHGGLILNPSEMACGIYNGFHIVLAATVPVTAGGTRPTTNQISAVSPVYMGLAQTSLQNAKVAMSTSASNAWVYFLDGTAEHQVRLKEFNYTTGGVTSYLDGADIKLNSGLASWYDPVSDERFVVYQRYSNSNNDIKEFNITTRDTQEITSADNPRVLTSIAACYYEEIVYVYFADGQDNLRRVIKRNGKWEPSTIVKNSPPVGLGQITVTTANDMNHIFYMARDDSMAKQDFTHLVDALVDA